MGMLELGQSKQEKRAVVTGLSVIHLGALGGVVTVFIAGLEDGMTLSPMLTVVAVIATTLWLFSFVLLFVNVAYYMLAPEEDDAPGDAHEVKDGSKDGGSSQPY